mmetsp:Transcript_13016/g.40888  ORF Transcript_13016/g.40888 Transcript_13016/m.40888 type:complete len:204 (-) Transcript_13016:67-678(-)
MCAAVAHWDPDDDLEALSVEELQDALRQREAVVAELQEELEHLERAPTDYENRLAQLEQAMASIRPGDVVKVRSPVLQNMASAVRQEHALRHEEAIQHHRELRQDEAHVRAEVERPRPEDLALGRSYLPLDLHWQEVMDMCRTASHQSRIHPTTGEVHYTEFMGQEGQTQALFVGPAGVTQQRPLRKLSPERTFWLDAPPGFQ